MYCDTRPDTPAHADPHTEKNIGIYTSTENTSLSRWYCNQSDNYTDNNMFLLYFKFCENYSFNELSINFSVLKKHFKILLNFEEFINRLLFVSNM